MAGILSTATSAAHFIIGKSSQLGALSEAIITFTCQLAVTMASAVSEVFRALSVLSAVFIEAIGKVILSTLELVAELFGFIVICLRLLATFASFLLTLGGYALSGVSIILQWISHGILLCMQHTYKHIIYLIHYCGLSSITLNGLKRVTFSICSQAESLLSDATGVISSSFNPLFSQLLQFFSLCSCAISSATLSSWNSLCTFMSAFTNLLASLLHAVYDSTVTNFSYELYLTFLLTSVAVGLCMIIVRSLHKKGLTFPLFLSASNQILQLDYDGDDEFIESDVDENDVLQGEEGDDDDEGEEEEEQDDIDEFSVASSESDNISDEEENDQNTINIYLPESSGKLRSRSTPGPSHSRIMSSRELEKHWESERDKRLCVVCVDQLKTVLVLPCKHMCLCVDCAREIAQSRAIERRICPLCRVQIETVMDIYV